MKNEEKLDKKELRVCFFRLWNLIYVKGNMLALCNIFIYSKFTKLLHTVAHESIHTPITQFFYEYILVYYVRFWHFVYTVMIYVYRDDDNKT